MSDVWWLLGGLRIISGPFWAVCIFRVDQRRLDLVELSLDRQKMKKLALFGRISIKLFITLLPKML